MKILYIITRSERGGAQMHVKDLLEAFDRDHEIALATGEDGYLCQIARGRGIPVHVISSLRQPLALLDNFAAACSLRTLIQKTQPDLIHAHTSKAGWVARLAGALSGFPVLYTAHAWSFAQETRKWVRILFVAAERLGTLLSSNIIVVSHASRETAIREGVAKKEQIAVIQNGVPDTAHRCVQETARRVRLIMVARFAAPKDQLTLITALRGCRGGFELYLVGCGPTARDAQTHVHKLGLSEHIHFLGDRDDVPDLLASAHVFVLSSYSEGLPISVLEAMRSQLPVIATDVGGVSEAVVDGESGFLVPAGNADAMRNRIEQLISSRELRLKMGSRGRALYEENFSSTTMLARVSEAYERVVTSQRARRPGRGTKHLTVAGPLTSCKHSNIESKLRHIPDRDS